VGDGIQYSLSPRTPTGPRRSDKEAKKIKVLQSAQSDHVKSVALQIPVVAAWPPAARHLCVANVTAQLRVNRRIDGCRVHVTQGYSQRDSGPGPKAVSSS
jgi:hypothetical protein